MESGSYGTGWWLLQGKAALSSLRESAHKNFSSRPLHITEEQTSILGHKKWYDDLFIVQSSEGF